MSLSLPLEPPPSTFGNVALRFREGDVELSDVTLPPHLSLPPHRHDRAQIVFVLEGLYEERVETAPLAKRRLSPGALILRGPGTLHSNRTGPRAARALLLDFGAHDLPDLHRAVSARSVRYAFDSISGEIAREIAGEATRGGGTASAAIECFARFLTSRLQRFTREPAVAAPPDGSSGLSRSPTRTPGTTSPSGDSPRGSASTRRL